MEHDTSGQVSITPHNFRQVCQALSQRTVPQLRQYCQNLQIPVRSSYVRKSQLIEIILHKIRSQQPGYQRPRHRMAYCQGPSQGKVVSVQGPRDSMEDTHVVVNYEDMSLWGVFDGHGGSGVSDKLPKLLAEYLLKKLPLGVRYQPSEVKKQIYVSFIEIDHILRQYPDCSSAGSTATLVLKIANIIYVINVGDSRTLIFTYSKGPGGAKKGNPSLIYTTIDHKPHLPSEKSRIEACGGRVEQSLGDEPRVDGYLAMSRAFGDFELKYHVPSQKSYGGPVSVQPDIQIIDMNEDYRYYLACASDGLWDVTTNKQVLQYLHHFDLIDGCQKLVEVALQSTGDNTTLLVSPI